MYVVGATRRRPHANHEKQYPASVGCDSAQIGAADTLSHLTAISAACPDQKYVLVGYSQGAGVIHLAAPKIPTSLYDRIVALVMYGDGGNPGPSFSDPPRTTTIPAFPDALNQKLKENCAFGDPVCSNGTSINAHLSYNAPNATYISGSAEYIQQQLQTNGKVGPQLSPNGGAPGPAALAALSSLGSVLGAVAGPTASKCGSGPASTGNATATITTTGSSAPLSSAATVASSAKATFTGGAMRLSPFGFLY